MPRNTVPNINASLIREVRMIAQQFFRSRENMSFNESFRPKPAKVEMPVLWCAKCYFEMTAPVKAVTIIDGNALCNAHAATHGKPQN